MKHNSSTLYDLTGVNWKRRTLVDVYYWTSNFKNELLTYTVEYNVDLDSFTLYRKDGTEKILSEKEVRQFVSSYFK